MEQNLYPRQQPTTLGLTTDERRTARCKRATEDSMKLPLISASVVTYTLIAMAWICYAELALA